MKNKLLFLVLILFSLVGMAKNCDSDNASVVNLQLQDEQWVTTTTAEVVIGIDATLDKSGLFQARENILKNLNQLVKTDWHLTEFSQTANESGLEQLHITATARIAEVGLNGLRDQAKILSKPGLAFSVVAINFVPSLTELETAKATLRSELYSAVQDEVVRLNKIAHDRNYTIRSITFSEGVPPPPVPVNAYMAMGDGAIKSKNMAAVVAVSSKIQMTAVVELATTKLSDNEKVTAKN